MGFAIYIMIYSVLKVLVLATAGGRHRGQLVITNQKLVNVPAYKCLKGVNDKGDFGLRVEL